MIVSLFFVFLVHNTGFIGACKPKTVNLNLETTLEFDKKDFAADVKIIDNVQSFLSKVRQVLNNTNQGYKRNYGDKKNLKFSAFIENALLVLKSYKDTELQEFFHIFDEELRKYHYKGCKFYELIQNNNVRMSISKILDLLRAPLRHIRKSLKKLIIKLQERQFTVFEMKIIDYLDSLYQSYEAGQHMYNALQGLEHYKIRGKRSGLDLSKVIKTAIRTILFDHYTNLKPNVRKDLRTKLTKYLKDFSPEMLLHASMTTLKSGENYVKSDYKNIGREITKKPTLKGKSKKYNHNQPVQLAHSKPNTNKDDIESTVLNRTQLIFKQTKDSKTEDNPTQETSQTEIKIYLTTNATTPKLAKHKSKKAKAKSKVKRKVKHKVKPKVKSAVKHKSETEIILKQNAPLLGQIEIKADNEKDSTKKPYTEISAEEKMVKRTKKKSSENGPKENNVTTTKKPQDNPKDNVKRLLSEYKHTKRSTQAKASIESAIPDEGSNSDEVTDKYRLLLEENGPAKYKKVHYISMYPEDVTDLLPTLIQTKYNKDYGKHKKEHTPKIKSQKGKTTPRTQNEETTTKKLKTRHKKPIKHAKKLITDYNVNVEVEEKHDKRNLAKILNNVKEKKSKHKKKTKTTKKAKTKHKKKHKSKEHTYKMHSKIRSTQLMKYFVSGLSGDDERGSKSDGDLDHRSARRHRHTDGPRRAKEKHNDTSDETPKPTKSDEISDNSKNNQHKSTTSNTKMSLRRELLITIPNESKTRDDHRRLLINRINSLEKQVDLMKHRFEKPDIDNEVRNYWLAGETLSSQIKDMTLSGKTTNNTADWFTTRLVPQTRYPDIPFWSGTIKGGYVTKRATTAHTRIDRPTRKPTQKTIVMVTSGASVEASPSHVAKTGLDQQKEDTYLLRNSQVETTEIKTTESTTTTTAESSTFKVYYKLLSKEEDETEKQNGIKYVKLDKNIFRSFSNVSKNSTNFVKTKGFWKDNIARKFDLVLKQEPNKTVIERAIIEVNAGNKLRTMRTINVTTMIKTSLTTKQTPVSETRVDEINMPKMSRTTEIKNKTETNSTIINIKRRTTVTTPEVVFHDFQNNIPEYTYTV